MGERVDLEPIRERLCNAPDGWWCPALREDGTYGIDVVDGSVITVLIPGGLLEHVAEYIANTKTDIAGLLAEVEHLRRGLERIDRHADICRDWPDMKCASAMRMMAREALND